MLYRLYIYIRYGTRLFPDTGCRKSTYDDDNKWRQKFCPLSVILYTVRKNELVTTIVQPVQV